MCTSWTHSVCLDDEDDDMMVDEEYLEEDGYLEEEELSSGGDDDSDNKNSKRRKSKSKSKGVQMRVKRTRVFRIARAMERQRGQTLAPFKKYYLCSYFNYILNYY